MHGLVQTGLQFPDESIQTSAATKVPAGTYINRIDTSGQPLAGGRVNEGSTLNVISPDGTAFTTVIFASYGNPSGTFPNFTLGSCHASNSKSIVEGYLLGKLSASIPATNAVFGEPCNGTAKRLAVVAATASGNIAVIDGWVAPDAVYSKTQYPDLYAAMGNETNVSMIPLIQNWGGWTSFGNSTGFAASAGDRRIDKIATNGNGTWIVLGDAGRIYRSTDDGLNWSVSQPTGTNDLTSVGANGDNFVLGSNTGANQYYSTNAGATWLTSTEGTASDDWGYAYSTVHGWWLKTTGNGNIMRSTNQGASWSTVLDLTGDSANNKIAYGNGYFVVVDGAGNVYASANGGNSFNNLGAIAGGAVDNWTSIKFRNGRFFAVGDNGNIAYTRPNTNPTSSSNWVARTDVFVRDAANDGSTELTDVEYLPNLGIWLIYTNISSYFWAPDFGQDLYFYKQTGSGLFGASTQGYGKLMYASGTLVVADIGLIDTDGYGNPQYGNGVARGKMTTVPTPPITHFWVPKSYQNIGLYYGQLSQVYVKA